MSFKKAKEIPQLIGHISRDQQMLPEKSKKDKMKNKNNEWKKKPQTTYLVFSNTSVFTLGSAGVLSQN